MLSKWIRCKIYYRFRKHVAIAWRGPAPISFIFVIPCLVDLLKLGTSFWWIFNAKLSANTNGQQKKRLRKKMGFLVKAFILLFGQPLNIKLAIPEGCKVWNNRSFHLRPRTFKNKVNKYRTERLYIKKDKNWLFSSKV